jgi:hypothetical protein
VQQAVDAAEIDEGAVVGDVLDHAADDLALGELVERRLLLLGVLLLEEHLAREHDVAALLVHLDDAHAELLPLERVEVAHRPDVDLAARQERAHADVDREPALDPLDDAADDDLAIRVGLLDLVPDLHLLGFFAREDDVAVAVFRALEQDVDDIARLHGHLALLVDELVCGNHAFRLEPDVDDYRRRGDTEHRALHDLAFRNAPEAGIVLLEKTRVLLRIRVVVFWGGEALQMGDRRRARALVLTSLRVRVVGLLDVL